MNTLSEYQREAAKTAIYPGAGDTTSVDGLSYATMGLVGEAGEIANKVKKILRDNEGVITDEASLAILYELGDVLWYVAALATQLNVDLTDIAGLNLGKLQARAAAGRLQGAGDSR
ncbi:nucleoside triphosphate pyrophosphohydrolase family protein [Mycobacteroides abscessus]|uniref:nucleoside triphosphate pyrophosphohydrolase family protein n=1 Tax=Mycobacteroides abscessus TaxID=36809 RepID=UPI0009284F38|nr:nucleoside triphosphate pyrophosphohydrolase family protein [Mycobacteroides abscessus]DAZ90303.1 TPA_asm: MazG-like nucleotide pyrophosphohydrolase [Mycobacterium phage prophiFSQJ01-1]SII40355.1 MazG nucleotide pyrophosphohydrolase domain [Mycobacteroides abscessus subsp. abscessus]SIK14888.1 MazG nucleotide pyrophosphohydrolase domain [Mycobacteroides abscessus subsp. abscessus]SIN24940.1 MazG nucleotide pyrophosphohydrolase domain [Mycobacteroides abscessus subsp. abscessus]SLI51994.1 Ma